MHEEDAAAGQELVRIERAHLATLNDSLMGGHCVLPKMWRRRPDCPAHQRHAQPTPGGHGRRFSTSGGQTASNSHAQRCDQRPDNLQQPCTEM